MKIKLDTPTPSSEWVTMVMNKVFKNDSGPFYRIHVSFALAPPEFPFTIYTVSLYNVSDTSQVSAVNVTKDNPSHVFKGISAGTYIVKVLPFDPYFNQGPDRCLCKNGKSNCFPCTHTITRSFTVGNSIYKDLSFLFKYNYNCSIVTKGSPSYRNYLPHRCCHWKAVWSSSLLDLIEIIAFCLLFNAEWKYNYAITLTHKTFSIRISRCFMTHMK